MRPIGLKENKLSIKNRYRPEIDGLRAFAVVAVIIYHFNKEILPHGYLGVDIFFVISGFVITSSLYRRPSKNFKAFISEFFERRIKRLVPALSVFVLIMSIAICFFNPEAKFSLRTGMGSLFGVSNLYLLKQSTDYFAQPTELNVFTHTWSLAVEEQFYILFPFLVWFSGFDRQTKHGTANLFLIVGTLTISSLIGFLYLYSINQSAAYFLLPTRFWEIASGCLIFIGLQKSKSLEHFLEKAPTTCVLILIVGIMYLPISWTKTSIVGVVLLTSVLIASLKDHTSIYRFFTNPKVVYIGKISYSLYLWHWGVLSISRWTIGVIWWSVPFQVALMFGLAIVSYRYIEMPLRNSKWFGNIMKTFVFGGGLLVTLFGVLVALERPLQGKLFIGNQYNQWNMKIFREIKIIHSSLLPTIYLIGDSHAGHYGAAMSQIVENKEFNLVMHPRGYGLKLQNDDIAEFVLAPLREYKNSFKNGDIIIFSAKVDRYQKYNQLIKHYETFLQQTKDKGLKFFMISPTPTIAQVKDAYICLEEWYRPSWAIPSICFAEVKKTKWLKSNNVPLSKIEKFLIANPKVFYIDTFSLFCPDTFCKTFDQKFLFYRDEDHLTSYGALKASDTIKTFIRSK